VIRDETMLNLAQALHQLSTEATEGERKTKMVADAKALLSKVQKGRNSDHFKTKLAQLKTELR